MMRIEKQMGPRPLKAKRSGCAPGVDQTQIEVTFLERSR